MWFVLDNSLILPEYLVEYEYITNQDQPEATHPQHEITDLVYAVNEANKIIKNTYLNPHVK